jgi:hypothetical protein
MMDESDPTATEMNNDNDSAPMNTSTSKSKGNDEINDPVDIDAESQTSNFQQKRPAPLHLETEMTEIESIDTLTAPLVISSSTNEHEIRNRQRSSSDMSRSTASRAGAARSTSPAFVYNRRRERVRECCHRAVEIQRNVWRNTISLMNFLAKVLFWASLIAMSAGIVYYTRELAIHGKEPHLIAWFSAGGFVILGFPISIYGILMHLTNYYQPNIQCYVVRILWMVPIYSIESWLCLRFHEVAIYIETLRDCYESFVLYCFFQYLIEVLGGEESLIMLLKDKSPTRGVHMWSMDWCIKPWVMGQPISAVDKETGQRTVRWTSPFFKNCKLGCLQYVLLKFILSIFTVVMEKLDFYKEGDFSYKSGYLYICILTNTSQCWALYCLIFFYFATKNELGPIRPVGKFLSVKALVFFTWWQSVAIAFLHQMDLIPAYEQGGWSSEEVAKGLQAYLICIEMFVASIVHTFVFPHTDYTRPLSTVRTPKGMHNFGRRVRVGRRFGRRNYMGLPNTSNDERSICSKTSDAPIHSSPRFDRENQSSDYRTTNLITTRVDEYSTLQCRQNSDKMKDGADCASPDINSKQKQKRTGFVNALIDSSVPRDVMDNTVGIARGDFTVEKKTLLYHAAASDEYSLFAKRRKAHGKKILTPKQN